MILKEIEIFGFKSFPVKSKIEFSFPIVAIVGPNGSGKSNVAEAFRFVLGEQSKKNMRSKNAEDLIWVGNEFKPAMNRARVSIIFDNKNRDFDIDFDELKIERVIYRDGVNEYYINDSQVRLKDIHELLASAKLGASSHHIISQGEADAILNASDKERLLMIKDALGLNAYAIKLKDAKNKLTRTQDNIKEARITLRELKPQLNFLEKQIEKKEKVDFLKEELACSYASYIFFERQKISKEKRDLLFQLAKDKQAFELAAKVFDDFKNQKNNAHDSGLKTKLSQLEERIYRLQKEYSSFNAELHAKKAEYETIKRLSAKKSEDVSDTVIVTFKLFKAVLEFFKDFLEGQASRSKAEKIFEELSRFSLETSTKNTVQKQDVNLQALKTKIKEMEKLLLNYNHEIEKMQESAKLLKEQIDASNRDEGRESKLISLSEKKSQAFSRFKKRESELYALKRKESELDAVLSEAKLLSGERFLRLFQDLNSGKNKLDRTVERLDIEKIKIRLEAIGDIDESSISEYKNLKEKMHFIETELQDLLESKKKTEKIIEELELKIKEEIKSGIAKISQEFKRFFNLLFGGGKAELEVYSFQNTDGIEEEALSVSVQIPGKKLSTLESLSGGERSLVSIALIFAISQVSPPPFIILDETDAALDEANSRKYSEILMMLAKNSQIISITHNRQSMSVAGELYGVTMGKDAISQIFSITLEDAESVAK